MRIHFSAVCLLVLLIGGCVAHEGVVIKKEYKPQDCFVRNELLLLVANNTTRKASVPVLFYDYEYFRIDIKRKDGAVETYYLNTKADYDRLPVGAFYKFDPKTADSSHRIVRVRLYEHEFAKVVQSVKATPPPPVILTTRPTTRPTTTTTPTSLPTTAPAKGDRK